MADLSNLSPESLDTRSADIAQKILNAETLEETKDLTALFNLNDRKRNVLRIMKMNNLLDDVTEKIIERFEKRPDNFTNEDLLKFMQATENSIDRANKKLNLVDETPAIQLIQNNQVNVNTVNGLDRESRLKVTETVQEILKRIAASNEEIIEATVADETEER